jgi:DNA-binding transcriptional regulator/RsmH inhibitor MraZ
MYYGSATNTLDGKGRVSFPKVFRQRLGEDAVSFVALDLDGTELRLWTTEAFEEWVRNIFPKKPGRPDRAEEQARRTVLSNALPLDLDDHKRLCLPKKIIQSLGLETEVEFSSDDDYIVLRKPSTTEAALTVTEAIYGKEEA